jgi:hypothetical protein
VIEFKWLMSSFLLKTNCSEEFEFSFFWQNLNSIFSRNNHRIYLFIDPNLKLKSSESFSPRNYMVKKIVTLRKLKWIITTIFTKADKKLLSHELGLWKIANFTSACCRTHTCNQMSKLYLYSFEILFSLKKEILLLRKLYWCFCLVIWNVGTILV